MTPPCRNLRRFFVNNYYLHIAIHYFVNIVNNNVKNTTSYIHGEQKML